MSDVTREEFDVLAARVQALDGRGPVVVPEAPAPVADSSAPVNPTPVGPVGPEPVPPPTEDALERAAARGVDISQVTGSGDGGQVTGGDVDAYADNHPAVPGA